jgi:predicted nucleic acid-binding protein
MHKVISNTTPILSLLKINKLCLLKELYGKIIIPKAVFDEIEKGKRKTYYKDLKQVNWIEILNIKNKDSLSYFFDLDKGEAEVLVLAHEQSADLTILDETAGRRYAKKLNLNITGTIGILLRAKEKEFVELIKPLLNELIEKGSWLNPRLIDKALELANEK